MALRHLPVKAEMLSGWDAAVWDLSRLQPRAMIAFIGGDVAHRSNCVVHAALYEHKEIHNEPDQAP